MSNKPDGGPAFPQDISMFFSDGEPVNCPEMEGHHGMSLRDYFAGQALSGLAGVAMQATVDRIVALIDGAEPRDTDDEEWRSMRVTAELAYDFADAMIAARER